MSKIPLLLTILLLVSGCSSHGHLRDTVKADVSDYKTSGKAVARAANDVLPDLNNVNTCPPGMKRINHTAGGSADSNIKVTERATTFSHTVEGGQSHDCKY